MRFTKMHGCGNDYVYINAFREQVENPSALAKKVSDRRFGIGSDGLILIGPATHPDAHAMMDMYNIDGSRGAMCGNGIRCVAKFLYDNGIARTETIRIQTLSGIKTVRVKTDSKGLVNSVTVDMGAPLFIDDPKLGIEACYVSMGNPHAVIFTDNVNDAPVESLGREIEEKFPGGINVEFIHVAAPDKMDFRVWERGSGETLACGTGACAALAAAHKLGKCDNKATVRLRGGELFIEWDTVKNNIYMTGEAVYVFEGDYPVG